MEVKTLFKDLKSDLSASIVVFFVALPLFPFFFLSRYSGKYGRRSLHGYC